MRCKLLSGVLLCAAAVTVLGAGSAEFRVPETLRPFSPLPIHGPQSLKSTNSALQARNFLFF
jgi:hypothetical protein